MDEVFWTNKEGQLLKIKDMTTEHIKNSVLMSINNNHYDIVIREMLSELEHRQEKEK